MKPQELDLHCFELRYYQTRIKRSRARSRLLTSIEANGQKSPVFAIPHNEQHILVDGYLRFDVIQSLGRDTILTHSVQMSECEALLHHLRLNQSRQPESIEEAWLLHTIMMTQGLSQTDIAHRLGKDKSWVSRRLSLITDLPEAIQLGVQKDWLSCWSAQRIFKPLARANQDHANQLLNSIKKNPMSTRELSNWYEHYKKSNHGQRKQLVEQPMLLLKALQQDNSSQELSEGIDGQWLSTSQKIVSMLKKLLKLLPQVLNPQTQPDSQLALLLDSANPIKALSDQLQQKLDEVNHVRRTNSDQHQTPIPSRDLDSTNQSDAQDFSQCGAPSSQGETDKRDSTKQTPQDYINAARALLSDERQCGSNS